MRTILVLAAAAAAAVAAPVPAGEARLATRADAPAFRIVQGAGTARLYMNATNGSPDVAVSELRLREGAQVPGHVHEASSETLFVVEGVLELTAGGRTFVAKAGDVITVPKGLRHSARVVSELRAVQVYSPAGPEQRYASGERVAEPGR